MLLAFLFQREEGSEPSRENAQLVLPLRVVRQEIQPQVESAAPREISKCNTAMEDDWLGIGEQLS